MALLRSHGQRFLVEEGEIASDFLTQPEVVRVKPEGEMEVKSRARED